jgi:hypothetical protein
MRPTEKHIRTGAKPSNRAAAWWTLLLSGAVFLSGGTARAATITASSTDFADVQAAINTAVEGDTVIVPAGASSWSNTLTITKGITLRGAGKSQTSLTGSGRILTIAPAMGKTCRVTGFHFDGMGRQFWNGMIGISGMARLDHCSLSGAAGWTVLATDCFGVIDHCLFRSYNGGVMVRHDSWGGHQYGDGSWADAPFLGTTKALYVEDCDFLNHGQIGAIDAVGGAHYVFRYNKVVGDILVCHGTDSTGRTRGTRAVEIYRNDMTGGPGYAEMFEMRSGTGVVFENTVRSYSGIANLKEFRSPESGVAFSWEPWGVAKGASPYDGNTDRSGYPCIDQCGRGKGDLLSQAMPTPAVWPHQAVEPVYAWGNTLNGGVGTIGSSYSAIKSGRDYINGTQMPGYRPLAYPHPLAVGI